MLTGVAAGSGLLRKRRRARLLTIGGVALLTAACGPRQNATHPSAPAAQDVGRPTLVIKRIAMDPVKIGNSLAAHVTVANTGNQPAINIKAVIAGTIIVQGDEEPHAMTEFPAPPTAIGDLAPQGSEELPAVNDRKIANAKDARVVTSGTWTPWVTGRVEYDGPGLQRYFTEFRAYYDLETMGYKFTIAGNDAN